MGPGELLSQVHHAFQTVSTQKLMVGVLSKLNNSAKRDPLMC